MKTFSIIFLFPLFLFANTETLHESFNLIESEYINVDEPNKSVPKWLRILGRDLAGALAGGATGAAAGGIGAGPGGLIGAIAGGASASIDAAGFVAPPNVGGTTNPSNPFDDAGKYHYESIDNAYENPSGIISTPESLNKGNFYQLVQQLVATEGVVSTSDFNQTFPQSSMESVMNQVSDVEDLLAFVNQLQTAGTLSQQEASIALSYINVFENSTNLNSFVSYSIQTENAINNSTQYSAHSKAIILSFMATARYGAAYWGVFE